MALSKFVELVVNDFLNRVVVGIGAMGGNPVSDLGGDEFSLGKSLLERVGAKGGGRHNAALLGVDGIERIAPGDLRFWEVWGGLKTPRRSRHWLLIQYSSQERSEQERGEVECPLGGSKGQVT